ncbi:MAG: nitroreductase family protein [Deltaproteobacteria bacterium]|nr:nitroreductase family protein [Deltaproteobacteria bacterium]
MILFSINIQTCNQDRICVAACPAGIIEMRKGEYPTPVTGAEDICIRCGHCVTVCPTGSLSHSEMPMEECPPVQKELDLSLEQSEQFLRARRSIRTYKEKSVPKNELFKLIELARYAPTGHNSQSVEWLVLGDRDELTKLSEVIVNWMRWMLENMSEAALSLQMDRAVRGWEKGKDTVLRGAPVVIVAHAGKKDVFAPSSSTITLSYLELAATSLGLGSCWAGYFNTAATTFPPMTEALSLPEGHQCLGSMMVGYPKFKYHRLPLRKSPKITWRL